ncbi:MAG TPA: hypothetical protein VJX67_12745 [Blastocatellia bacterium]|nr:hypothetical protein [Blastocatellia bacterium]
MLHQKVRNEFSVRFYRWALQDTLREIAAGFPLVGLVKGSQAKSVIRFFESLSETDRIATARSLVKRGNPVGADLVTESLTKREELLIEQYMSRLFELSSPYFGEIATPSRKRASRGALRAALKQVLPEVCGSIVHRDSAAIWVHSTPIGPWVVVTEVDTGGTPTQLSYHHYITLSSNPADHLSAALVSLLGWIGIGMTEWDMLSASEEQDAAKALGVICQHFISAVPFLLDGLL